MIPRRIAGQIPTVLGLTGLLLYAWNRYFLPDGLLTLVFALMGFLLATVGGYLLMGMQVARRWRTPARLLRWNAILSVIGLGHFFVWGLLSLLISSEAYRSYSLITAFIEIGIILQAAGHLTIAGHLIGIRIRPVKIIVIVAYFILIAFVLAFRLVSPTVGSFVTPLLWVGILPLLYFSEWLQEVASRRIPEALLLLAGTLVILFIEWQVLPTLFFTSYPPALEQLHSLLIGIIFLHGGWVVVPLLLRMTQTSRGESAVLELMTDFLAQQQRSTSAQAVLEITRDTFRRLPSVGGCLLLLRSAPEETQEVSTLSEGSVLEHIRKLLLQRSGTETHVEVVDSLQKVHRRLPDLTVILIQRPLLRLSGALLNQTLSVAVLSAVADGFEERDIELITTLTDQTALFLENLERRSYQEQLLTTRKEIDFLRETREALMPPPPPILKRVDFYVHFEQYDRTIGGDYYQINEYPEGDIVDFWLSDSAGSGIAAAYQMAQARAALNTLWLQKLSAEELLFRLNDALKRVFHKNNFLAATLLRLDLIRKEYILLRAGNPEVFYWNPLTDNVDILRPSGIVLGNASSQIIRRILMPERGRLLPGSLFFFFSDGFSEASSASGEMFGTERLLSLFEAHAHATPKEIAEAVVQAVRDFTGGTSLGDDGTLMVVRYLG